MMRKAVVIILLSAASWINGFSQNISNYQLVQNSNVGIMTDMAGSQQLIGANQSEVASPVHNIGFNFVFMGKSYNTFSVNTNGVMRLGDEQILAGANAYGIPGNDRIVPMAGTTVYYRYQGGNWKGAQVALRTGDEQVHYKVTGTAPNRILTVEWNSVYFYIAGVTAGGGIFQVRLYESAIGSEESGAVEFVYDSFALWFAQDYDGIFVFRTGFGIGPENGNFVAIDHNNRSLTSTANYQSSVYGTGYRTFFTSNTYNDKLLYRFESFRKPVGQFSNFQTVCPSPNALSIQFEEDCTDEAGIVVYRKLLGEDDAQYRLVKSVAADARVISDENVNIGERYVYRFYLLGESKMSDVYQEYTTESVEAGSAYQAVVSGAWTDADTWGGIVPGTDNDVEVGCVGSMFVDITGEAYVRNLTIQSGSFLTINDGSTLYVSGDFVNNGVFTPIGSGRLVLNGSSQQAITNNGRSLTDDVSFSATGTMPVWNDDQTGMVGETVIQVNDADFAAIKSVTVDIDYGFLRDLNLYLIAPNGQTFSLSRGRGQQGVDYTNVTFVETGQALPPTTQNVNLTGEYRPEESFASYSGPYNGNWTLHIHDNFAGYGGMLNSFSITLSKGISNDLIMRNFAIDNSQGIVLNAGLKIEENLQLIEGIVYTSDAAPLMLEAGAVSNAGSTTSFVDGPVFKAGSTNFTFPVGDQGKWAPVALENMQMADDATTFRVEYYKQGHTAENLEAALDEVSTREYWEIEPQTGSPTVDIVLQWKDVNFSQLRKAINTAKLVVAHYTEGNWKNEGGSFQITDSKTMQGYITINSISTFSPFTFGSEGEATLPVELISFKGTQQADGILLQWETASEINNSHFEVERSSNLKDWTTIGSVNGQGNSSKQHHYQYLDQEVFKGAYYFRLKQVDYDGQYVYSNIINLHLTQETATFSVYPNPARDQITVESSQYPATIELINQGGASVFSQKIDQFQSQVQLPYLASGVYMIKLAHRGDTQYQKIIITD